jgi:hypothetical protein
VNIQPNATTAMIGRMRSIAEAIPEDTCSPIIAIIANAARIPNPAIQRKYLGNIV